MAFQKGTLISLRKLRLKDYPTFHKWISDKEVTKYSLNRWLRKHTPTEVKDWLEKTLQDKTVINFGIIEISTKQLIGYAGISSISKTNHSGEYFILIGDKSSWGKGYGTKVTKLVLEYGFKKLNLHRIALTVSEPNKGGLKAYTKAGFKKEGVMRDASFRDGQYHDKILMSVLAPEWKSE